MKKQPHRPRPVSSAYTRLSFLFGKVLGCLVSLTVILQLGSVALGATKPTFIQEKDHRVTSGTTSPATFSSPTTAGNLIVVYLIWDNTGGASVSDSLGNTYASAVGPTHWNGLYSAQVFYTINLRGGGDTVTARFATRVRFFGIVYAHEYSGVRQTAPVDVTAANAGTSGPLGSGSATTTNDTDLLFAGGVSAQTVTSPGAGYTARSTSQGNMTEDRIVSAKGSYSATASNSGGAWAMQMVAFKGVADTTAPTVPIGLTATAVSSSQITLSWVASTDPDNTPSQITYGVYRNGVRVATTAAGVTSFADSGLAASTTYSYAVSAYDPAGNNSAQSSAVQATSLPLLDATPPTTPTNLSVIGTSPSTVTLAWTASTDNVAVAGYKIYRGGVQIGTSGVAAYTDAGLTASTTYAYTVSAYDAASNNSAQTAPVSATTGALDTQAPTVSITSPANNQTVSGISTVAANAADNVAVVGVQFQLDGGNLGAEVTTSPYSTSWNTSETTNALHLLTAVARDAAGNKTASSGVTVTVSNTSLRPYSTSFPLTENPISENGNWVGGQTAGNNLWGNVQTTPGQAFGVSQPTSYGDPSALLTGTWNATQTVQATVKVNTVPTGNCCHEVEVRLRNTIDSSAHTITGYELYCSIMSNNQYCHIASWGGPNGAYVNLDECTGESFSTYLKDGDVLKATVTDTNPVIITGFINGTQFLQVQDTGACVFSDGEKYGPWTSGNPGIGFYDAQGTNWSYFGFSSFLASEGLTSDTIPPSIPANLSATVISSSQIDLSWSPSTDNVAVAGYQVFRNGTQIATAPSSSLSDNAALPGTQYTYAVAAFDAAGNVSAQSSPVVATTPSGTDITPPSVPTNLQSSNITSATVTVAWSASTDDVAVAGYRIFRDGIQVATTTATRYADTGLVASTSYVYTVAAYDGSNNVSAQSQQLIVTTISAALIAPSIVQVNQNQISSGASTSVTFHTPTVAGNTIVVYVIWSNVGSVSVTDSRGDTFANVGTPLSWGNGYCAQIFYAPGIAGGTDTVTATFRTSVTSFGVVYVHEYAGISAINPVDVTTSASGSSASLNSGTATTTSANDLIFGAGVSDNTVTAAGSGFISRNLAYGNITEDRIAGSIGSYAATAPHNGKMWGMQLVAFRAAQ